MIDRKKLEKIFQAYSFTDFKWIDPKKIVIAHWVRMKCMFGCSEYGKTATCPPNVPSFSECEKFFNEYSDVIVFHFGIKLAKPEDRFAWTKKISMKLLKLEREVFISGFQKAFLLFLDSCSICQECSGVIGECKEPKFARPTPEAMCIDVFSTVRSIGYPIQVLSDYGQEMNRYAFLLIE